MNTRMVVTTKNWFGGGGDLTPMLSAARTPAHEDTRDFHAAFKSACDAHNADYYPRFKAECDDYFFLPTAMKRAALAAFSMTTSTRATGRLILPSPKMSGAPSSILIPTSPPAGSPNLVRKKTARAKCVSAGVMSNLICFMIAELCSGSKPAAMSTAFCPPCRPASSGHNKNAR